MSLSLLVQSIPCSVKSSLVNQLVEKLDLGEPEKCSDVVNALGELVGESGLAVNDTDARKILGFSKSLFSTIPLDQLSNHQVFADTLVLCSRIPQAVCTIVDEFYAIVVAHLKSSSVDYSKYEFLERLPVKGESLLASDIKPEIDSNHSDVLFHLYAISRFLLHQSESSNMELGSIVMSCILFMSIDSESSTQHSQLSLASLCSQSIVWALRRAVDDPEVNALLWQFIRTSIKNKPENVDSTIPYVLWLKWVSIELPAVSEYFNCHLASDVNYWKLLQSGLAFDSHDIRKYTTVILDLSVRLLDKPVDNEYITWDDKEREVLLQEWSRYHTLLEVISIDTSIHEVKASESSLRHLFSPECKIPASWGVCLLTVGIDSSMDSVRKFVMNFVFSLSSDSLAKSSTDEGVRFVIHKLLRYGLTAQHFKTERAEQLEPEDLYGDYICPHAEQLVSFLQDLMLSYEDNAQSKMMATHILQLIIDSKYAYDPARVYSLYGLLKASEARQLVDQSHCEMISAIFEVDAETAMRTRIIRVLCLELMLKLDSTISNMPYMIKFLAKFCKRCGFSIYKEKLSRIHDWFLKLDSTATQEVIGLFDNPPDDVHIYEGSFLPVLIDVSLAMVGSLESEAHQAGLHADIQQKSQAFISNRLDIIFHLLSADIPTIVTVVKKWDFVDTIFRQYLRDLLFSPPIFSGTQYETLRLCCELVNSDPDYHLRFVFPTDSPEECTELVRRVIALYENLESQLQDADYDAFKGYVYFTSLLSTVYISGLNMIAGLSGDSSDDLKTVLIDFRSLVRIHQTLRQTLMNRNSKERDFHVYWDIILEAIFKLYTEVIDTTAREFITSDHVSEDLFDGLFAQIESDIQDLELRSRLALVTFFKRFTEALVSEDSEMGLFDDRSVPVIDRSLQILHQLWQSVLDDRLAANERKLHRELIKLLFSPLFLDYSLVSRFYGIDASSVLKEASQDIIEQSYARRGLAPVLSQCFHRYQISCDDRKNNNFLRSEWIGIVLVEILILSQIDDSHFFLETTMARLANRDIYGSRDDQASVDVYRESHGDLEISSKIYAIAVLASIGGLPRELETEHEKLARRFASNLSNHILNSDSTWHIFIAVKRSDGIEEKRRIRLYSILLMLHPLLSQEEIAAHLDKYYFPALRTEQSPLVRTYIEWIIGKSLILLNSYQNAFELLNMMKDDPRITISMERIGYLVASELGDNEKEVRFLTDNYLPVLLAFCTANKAGLRHFSVSLVCTLYPKLSTTDFAKGLSQEVIRSLEAVYKHATNTEGYSQFRSGDFTVWSLSNDYTLVGIWGNVLTRISDREVDGISEHQFSSVLGPSVSYLKIPVGKNDAVTWKTGGKSTVKDSNLSFPGSKDHKIMEPVQRKSGTWKVLMEDSEESARGNGIKRSDLIVLASLVDKAPNLGGICRVCDALGAGLLCLDDVNVARNSQFRSVAVTSDLWMPMQEVKIPDIISFMKAKKREGYTLIGLEQTDKSVILSDGTQFPRKSLIVLGREREGIDAGILAELDFCVEIKQVGVVRSMNIQTACAVVVHAYAAQHC